MEMEPYRIGRGVKNDFLIDNRSVSGNHALIHISQDFETFILEDCESTNGTFVNDQPIVKKEVTQKDKIRLGDFELNSKELWSKLRKYIHNNRKDFSKEFSALQSVEKNFQKDKDKANRFFKIKSAVLRLAITVTIMLIVGQFTPREYRIYLMGAIGLIGTVISTLSMSEDRLRNKIEDLTVEFTSTFSCPKCEMELAGKSWKYWKKKKKCPQCSCDWVSTKTL